MKMKITLITLLSILLVLPGCDMLDSHPYDVSVSGKRHLTDSNVAEIEARTYGKREIRFVMISDTQRGYDETNDAVRSINSMPDVDFVVHGGDLTEFGSTREFEWKRDILNKLDVPYVCVIGNHDCLATGPQVYRSMFGEFNYSFVAGDVLFVCLNTNAMEFDYSVDVPDFSFIRRQLSGIPDRVRKTVILMHAPPRSDQFHDNVAEEFHSLVARFPDVQFCLYGHCHEIAVDDMFGDGIIYYQCANIKKRSYLTFTINEDSYEYRVVRF